MPPAEPPTLHALAAAWLEHDRDPTTRAEILALLAASDTRELARRLRGRIAFGTAGLRGRMEAGTTRVNSLTVARASQGLAAYLLAAVPGAAARGVVVGRDARHGSARFAALAAAAFLARGVRVWWCAGAVHTPLVPFAVGLLGAAAGVVVTASHNPRQDNGYKVYWGNGCQIVPPRDEGIAAAIAREVGVDSWALDEGDERFGVVAEDVVEAYYQRVVEVATAGGEMPALPPFVYTPLHGVGLEAMQRAMRRLVAAGAAVDAAAGEGFVVVPEQALPDPDFPTVTFPNPEEAGALDLAVRTADGHAISLIVANDPDADRLAVAEKISSGRWHQYTGNQLGVLLASHVLDAMYPRPEDRGRLAMLCSTVSTGMLRAMAEAEGFHFAETLTGFKWLGNVAQQLAAEQGYAVPYAFEEAIGYMFTAVVHDKDGVAAAAVFLAAAARWRRAALTPWQRLQQLYEKYGYFADANTYLVSPGADVTNAVFDDVRAKRTRTDEKQHADAPFPSQLGKRSILRWRDLTLGYDSSTPDNVPVLPVDKASQMITCELEDDVRFTVRGSGTEPKIKLYVEAKGETWDQAEKKAVETQQDLIHEWFIPEKYGLALK